MSGFKKSNKKPNGVSTTTMIQSLNKADGISGGFFSGGLIGSQKAFVKKYISVNAVNQKLSYAMLGIGLSSIAAVTYLIWQNHINFFNLMLIPAGYALCDPLVFKTNLKRIDNTPEFQIAYINHHLKNYFGEQWAKMDILCDQDKTNAEYDGKPMLERVGFFTENFCIGSDSNFLAVLTSIVNHTVGKSGIRKSLHQDVLRRIFPSDFNFHKYREILEKARELRGKVIEFNESWVEKFVEDFPLIMKTDEALGQFHDFDEVQASYQDALTKYNTIRHVVKILRDINENGEVVSVVTLEDEESAILFKEEMDNILSVDRLWNHQDPVSEVKRYYEQAPETLKTRHLRAHL